MHSVYVYPFFFNPYFIGDLILRLPELACPVINQPIDAPAELCGLIPADLIDGFAFQPFVDARLLNVNYFYRSTTIIFTES